MGYCGWADTNERNKEYHDNEWGIPVHDDRKMFEHLTLECMQCGLSWDLMLRKRDIFRKCFDDFDYVLGDYAYSKLRLKGFYDSENKKASKINDISGLDDYIKDYCAYDCGYFLLKKE